MELPNNSKPEFMMNFKKFATSVKNLIYHDEKVFLKGTFREKKTGEIIKGDNFWANVVHTSGKKATAEEIYKTYIEWFNRTSLSESKREFVKAEIVKNKEVD